jgi:hypothetical protein
MGALPKPFITVQYELRNQRNPRKGNDWDYVGLRV